MTERPFTWGIVGAGVIARQFVDDLSHAPGARVGAFHTRSGRLPDGFAADAPVHASLDALIADPAIDAVYLATPNSAHAEQALAAIAAGKPVLVEKPLATTSADAHRIADAASAAQVFAMEAMWTRFLPAVQAARDLIQSGAIGAVESVEAELAYWHKETPDSRLFDPALGGGASLDLGVYPLSLAMFLLGQPTHVAGQWTIASTGVDLSADYQLRFGEIEARLSCGFNRPGSNHLLVMGDKGALLLHAPFLKAQRLSVFGPRSKDWMLFGPVPPVGGRIGRALARLPLPGREIRNAVFPGNGLQFEAQAVMDAVRAGKTASDIAPLHDSVAVLKVIETVLATKPRPNLPFGFDSIGAAAAAGA